MAPLYLLAKKRYHEPEERGLIDQWRKPGLNQW